MDADAVRGMRGADEARVVGMVARAADDIAAAIPGFVERM